MDGSQTLPADGKNPLVTLTSKNAGPPQAMRTQQLPSKRMPCRTLVDIRKHQR